MADPGKFKFSFDKLPVWKNVQDVPGGLEFMEFSLGWDERGYVRQTTPSDVQERICRIYADEKYNFITQPPGASIWANRLGDEKIAFIDSVYDDLKGKTVLEIGAGSLYIAERLVVTHGIRKYIGIDPAIKDVPNIQNIEIIREYFTNGTIIDEGIDLVVSFNCLEHVADPAGFLGNVHRVLSTTGGMGVLVFPDVEQQFKRGDFNAILHEHINYFTKDTATKLMCDCGFNVLVSKVEHDSIKLLVQPLTTPKDRVGKGQADMGSFFFNSICLFNTNLENFKKHLTLNLASGKRVAFHGANNGLNNIMALAGLSDTSWITVFDGDESKTGKFLPACANPIRHSKDPFYSQVDEIYISATTFLDEIREFLFTFHNIDPSKVRPLYPFTG